MKLKLGRKYLLANGEEIIIDDYSLAAFTATLTAFSQPSGEVPEFRMLYWNSSKEEIKYMKNGTSINDPTGKYTIIKRIKDKKPTPQPGEFWLTRDGGRAYITHLDFKDDFPVKGFYSGAEYWEWLPNGFALYCESKTGLDLIKKDPDQSYDTTKYKFPKISKTTEG